MKRNEEEKLKVAIVSDDTSIFIWTRGTLNIKDQAGRSAHKVVGPISNISRVIS
jgi:hypothetical protein